MIWPDHLEEGGRGNLYRVVLQELVEEASQEEEIVGMLLTGSVARGDALPDSEQVLMGLWAVNDKPMPPNGSVLVHLKDLSKRPFDLEGQINHFFCGETSHRVQTAIDLIDWILEHLKSSKIET